MHIFFMWHLNQNCIRIKAYYKKPAHRYGRGKRLFIHAHTSFQKIFRALKWKTKRRANLKSMVTLNVPDSPLRVLFFRIKKGRSLCRGKLDPPLPSSWDTTGWEWLKAVALAEGKCSGMVWRPQRSGLTTLIGYVQCAQKPVSGLEEQRRQIQNMRQQVDQQVQKNEDTAISFLTRMFK